MLYSAPTESKEEAARHPNKKLILYWGKNCKPEDFINNKISKENRLKIAKVLKSGKVLVSYKGWATCRICKKHLGSQDVGSGKYVWPSQAEHYILEHNVWIEQLDDLL